MHLGLSRRANSQLWFHCRIIWHMLSIWSKNVERSWAWCWLVQSTPKPAYLQLPLCLLAAPHSPVCHMAKVVAAQLWEWRGSAKVWLEHRFDTLDRRIVRGSSWGEKKPGSLQQRVQAAWVSTDQGTNDKTWICLSARAWFGQAIPPSWTSPC